MLLDFYAAKYARMSAQGQSIEEFEDDPELSLDKILESLDEGSWEDIEATFDRPDETE